VAGVILLPTDALIARFGEMAEIRRPRTAALETRWSALTQRSTN
jgi:hypothetical protein